MAQQINSRYLVSGLVSKLKTDLLMAANQTTYNDGDYAYILSNELWGTVLPNITKFKTDLLLTTKDYTTVRNQANYEIPYRATGQKVRTVSWKFNNNSQDTQANYTKIPMISPESISSWNVQTQASWGFYIEGNDIIMYPLPLEVQQFTIWYYRRPNELIPDQQGSRVAGILPNNTLLLSNIPTSATGNTPWVPGDLVDIVRPFPPFKTVLEDVEIVSVSLPDVSVQLSDTTGLDINDTIALAGRAIVPQIPVELHQYLVQCAVVKVLEGMKDDKGMALATRKLEVLTDQLFNQITPRVESDPPRLVGSSGISLYNKPGLRWGNR